MAKGKFQPTTHTPIPSRTQMPYPAPKLEGHWHCYSPYFADPIVPTAKIVEYLHKTGHAPSARAVLHENRIYFPNEVPQGSFSGSTFSHISHTITDFIAGWEAAVRHMKDKS